MSAPSTAFTLHTEFWRTTLKVFFYRKLIVSVKSFILVYLAFLDFVEVLWKLIFFLIVINETKKEGAKGYENSIESTDITQEHELVVDGSVNLYDISIHINVDWYPSVIVVPSVIHVGLSDFKPFDCIICQTLRCKHQIVIFLDTDLRNLQFILSLSSRESEPGHEWFF